MLEFNRRDIKAMIMGPKPPKGPEGKNVLWMDTHSAVPLLRVWLNDRWTAVENTDSETIHIDFEGVKADVRELQSYFRQDGSIVVTNVDCRGGLLKLGNTELLESELITFFGFDDRITALEQGAGGYTAGDNITIEDGVISAIDTTYSNATEETSGLMSYHDKIKLNGLNNYVLPKASASTLGGIKVGSNLSIDSDGVLSASGGSSDHTIDTTTLSGKIIITKDSHSFAVNAEEIVAPADVQLTTGGTFIGSKSVSMTCSTSGATIYYTMTSDGSTPADPTTSSVAYTSALTLSQDDSVQTKTYKIKAKAFKNGMGSTDIASATYEVTRQLAAPAILVTGNDYSTSRTATISHTNQSVTLKYRYAPTDEWQTYSSALTIDTTKVVYAQASLSGWESSTASQNVVVGKNKCYIGQAASVESVNDIKALANGYEQDTLVGSTKVVSVTTSSATAQYVWFAIPDTVAKNLTVTVNNAALPTPVPLQATGGALIPATNSVYRVWRSETPLFNQSGSYDFKLV